MLCSEIGSEGRNFQFASHLVMFDLPFNPDLLEQRIGRLDRIGQVHDIQIHVPYRKPRNPCWCVGTTKVWMRSNTLARPDVPSMTRYITI